MQGNSVAKTFHLLLVGCVEVPRKFKVYPTRSNKERRKCAEYGTLLQYHVSVGKSSNRLHAWVWLLTSLFCRNSKKNFKTPSYFSFHIVNNLQPSSFRFDSFWECMSISLSPLKFTFLHTRDGHFCFTLSDYFKSCIHFIMGEISWSKLKHWFYYNLDNEQVALEVTF